MFQLKAPLQYSRAKQKPSITHKQDLNDHLHHGADMNIRYLRVAEEEQAEDRIGSEEVNEGAAQAPARQR